MSKGFNHSAKFTVVNSQGIHDKPDDTLSDVVDLDHPDDLEEATEDQQFLDDDGNELQSPNPGSQHSENELTAREKFYGVSESRVMKGKEAARERKPSTGDHEMDEPWRDRSDLESSMEYYIRNTHGIPLESLSIHLIPVKPTVLFRAVDISRLKHLSLLNVGSQRHIWIMFEKLAVSQLTSIHTDNVTQEFLSFVGTLDKVTELFMIERSSQAKPESFAPKTTVEIEDIHQSVLKKHMKSLRRLMIRNDEDSSWAFDYHSLCYLAKFGTNLTELAIGLNSRNFVSPPIARSNIFCYVALLQRRCASTMHARSVGVQN